MSQFKTPPPSPQYSKLTFPSPNNSILLVTLSRPKALNSINSAGHAELHRIWEWMDDEPSIRVGVITGEGRAFCAGADLKGILSTFSILSLFLEWNASVSSNTDRNLPPSSGFGGLSRRSGKKPIIAAVNGLCLGGGCEMITNTDIVIASEGAFFGFPEVQRGVVAWAGALPRIVRTIGKQRAMEMVLTGRRVSAREAERWGFVNEVVAGGDGDGEVVRRAIEVAGVIAGNSPDAVIVSREGVKMGWEGLGAEEASRLLAEGWEKKLNAGENIKEGLKAFVEKRKPVWKESKL
ncbi:enoyl-CoA hydratase/isomerase family protein [Aspergillus stella-maris]|uniref:enoyl-CoA hydratase/isomerase family protein n=1 Tax=Aspergillus stella-maris TaxID=1810926 RepID=UPI003CCE3500